MPLYEIEGIAPLIGGSPARAVRALSEEERHSLLVSAALYAGKAARFAAGLRLHS